MSLGLSLLSLINNGKYQTFPGKHPALMKILQRKVGVLLKLRIFGVGGIDSGYKNVSSTIVVLSNCIFWTLNTER